MQDVEPPPVSAISGSAAPTPHADVLPLLRAYRTVLGLAGELPPSRAVRPLWLRRLLTALRPTWGFERFLVEHMRDRVEQLSRRYCLRLALGEDDGNDAADREALERFTRSLPPRQGALRRTLPLIAIIIVGQLLMVWLGDLAGEQEAFAYLTKITSLSPGSVAEAIVSITKVSIAVLLDLAGVFTLAAYLVLWPFVPGFRLKRMMLAQPGALGRRARRSPLGQVAQRLDVHGQEAELFRALGMRPPAESAFDLRVKFIFVAFATVGGVYFLLKTPDYSVAGAVFFLWLAAVRAIQLALQQRRRTLRHHSLVSAYSEAPSLH